MLFGEHSVGKFHYSDNRLPGLFDNQCVRLADDSNDYFFLINFQYLDVINRRGIKTDVDI